MKFQTIRGVHDGLPAVVARWQQVERVARTIFHSHSFDEVRLPILEQTALFTRSVGEATDIVAKEMYRFVDRGGDDLCLRPEGTAGAVRAFIQGGLGRAGEQRWFYVGPMFRRERPQKGRLRQFQQIGVERFGAAGPVADIEMLTMAWSLVAELGIQQVRLELNSLGCPSCRPGYRDALVAFLQQCEGDLCATCRDRMATNPMRVLDCKVASCQQALTDAPEMLHHLCGDCDTHFGAIQRGLDIPVTINPRIVRGLDYYNRTAFEIVTDQLGAQGTVIAGGRYDGLVQELGGAATPAIGFALGLERIGLLLSDPPATRAEVAVVALGEGALIPSLRAAEQLRAAGLRTIHCGGGGGKRQFKQADRCGARFTIILGEDEVAQGTWTVRNMGEGSQQQCDPASAMAQLVQHFATTRTSKE
ncbi:MAG: histidine--tRNA ligase [Mariprofundales bacterium]|nr:histidine--tRNA ligase [Mariprofundales bacterium]